MRLATLFCSLLLALAIGCGGSDDGGGTDNDSDAIQGEGGKGGVGGSGGGGGGEAACTGAKRPGDRCRDGAWICEPSAADLDSCPSRLCSTCDGFDGPVFDGFCICDCVNDGVACYEEIIEPA